MTFRESKSLAGSIFVCGKDGRLLRTIKGRGVDFYQLHTIQINHCLYSFGYGFRVMAKKYTCLVTVDSV